MTESIFDPTGPQTEHSGSRNLGPDAGSISHLPPEVTDGTTDEEEDSPEESELTQQIARAEKEHDTPTRPQAHSDESGDS